MKTIKYKDVAIGEQFTVNTGNVYVKGWRGNTQEEVSVCIKVVDRMCISGDGKFIPDSEVQVDRPLLFSDLVPGDSFSFKENSYIKTEVVQTPGYTLYNAITVKGVHVYFNSNEPVLTEEPF